MIVYIKTSSLFESYLIVAICCFGQTRMIVFSSNLTIKEYIYRAFTAQYTSAYQKHRKMIFFGGGAHFLNDLNKVLLFYIDCLGFMQEETL